MLQNELVADYFTRLIMRVMPKSYIQAMAEVTVVRQFLKNFGGDRVRFLAAGQHTPGDRPGQRPHDYRWPYGPVVIISPFNFPLEIPALQLLGALYMGNRPTMKSATTVSIVIEQFIRLLQACGLPMTDVDLIHAGGKVVHELLKRTVDIVRMVQFTGSSTVAEELAVMLRGKIRVEDAGFDWKILGPDFNPGYLNYVADQCDQDTNAATGQKCSKTSILFVHDNWWNGGLIERIKERAARRNIGDLTNGAILTETNQRILDHIAELLKLRGLSMQKAVPVGEGGMAALLGADIKKASALANASAQGEVCTVANDNDPTQVVISGHIGAIERAIAAAKDHGIKRGILLPVSAPFHCSLMAPAAEAMEEALAEATILPPVVPVFANVSAAPVSDVNEIRDLLVQQVTGTVRWRESVAHMAESGVEQFVEFGGKVLTGMVGRIAPDAETVSLVSPADIEAFLKSL
ncbi:MAG: hypothetical protein COY66_05540 [Candidatus Kerfeldbacteria bacterium CG_4_10_14_0_8_um_filter_42_10]|uniref:[acyl-carrier-protein] S-malonyltransferase n=1 Tax=Candidatus Kerfeldbacteria bacterium CG_4_10_14_0_8_um_filter_42_10 TaxID=2014248 RepID=A0A2M7RGW5_9BACT|nr:MAG: hypothetical protein COY66_05540 [Candidatus Kerfeldbacteria bacterium CG_4_10_14_0_8_um_filter_42_10]